MPTNTQFLPVDAAYNRWSRFYDFYANPMVYMATQIVTRSLADVAGQRVFEFGCGTGRNLAACASSGAASVAGCDLSRGMLDVAVQRVPAATLLEHDMTQPLAIADASVDVALFCLSLEHIADLAVPLTEAARIVRRGGRIAIVEIHPFLSLNGVAAHFDEGDTEVRMPTYAHQFGDYLRAFASLELTLRACREWRPIDVGNPRELQSAKRAPSVPLAVEFSLER